jgi:exodeoxyribonuclease-3
MKSGFVDSFAISTGATSIFMVGYRAGARGNNKGWRIDYNLVSEKI